MIGAWPLPHWLGRASLRLSEIAMMPIACLSIGDLMSARLRVLPVGLAMVAALAAGCSSTTSEPTGAVQDDVAISQSPSPASPGAVASGAPNAAVSIAPEPSSGSGGGPSAPSSVSALLGSATSGDVCDSGLPYACGGTGPGGGTVFYASSTPFACGAGMASACNFLEAAPNLWAPNSQSSCRSAGGTCGGSAQQTSDFAFSGKGITLCTGSGMENVNAGATETVIGSGYANTTALLPVCNSGDAPNAARSYNGGGKTDWSVPSLNELTALYSYPNRNAIGGFPPSDYWSSSNDRSFVGAATVTNFNGGSNKRTQSMDLWQTFGLRPVRAF